MPLLGEGVGEPLRCAIGVLLLRCSIVLSKIRLKIFKAVAATLLLGGGGIGGAVAYASVDADFRKLLEESVPGSDQVTLLRDQLMSAFYPGSRVANWSPRTSPTSTKTCS